jgi:MFS family permease
MVGVYVAIRVGAQMLSNLAWGQLSDRRGNRLVMRLLNLANGLTALLALLLVGMVQVMDLQGPWLPYLALPLFFLNGVSLPAKTISGSNFLLELVPDGDRQLYLGLSNTLMGVVVIVSGLGGLVVDLLGFVGLFAVTLGLGALGYVLATRLPEPRREASE